MLVEVRKAPGHQVISENRKNVACAIYRDGVVQLLQ
jgi:hypothetical protein